MVVRALSALHCTAPQARAIMLLSAVLLGVGYSPKRLTILSAYVGQLLLLRAALDASGMGEIELSTADPHVTLKGLS